MDDHRAKHGSTCHYANSWVIIGNGLAPRGLLAGFILLGHKVMRCNDECFNPLVLGIQCSCLLDMRG